MIVQIERRLWTAFEYHEMVEAGILNENDRLELIEGEVIRMSPVGVKHLGCVNQFSNLLSHYLFGQVVVSIQNPIRLNDLSEPGPDVVVLNFREDGYASRMPTAEDVILLIEVSDSTLAYDRVVKRPLYALSGVPEYWLANLIDNSIEVYRKPDGDKYTESFVVYGDEEISAVAFPEVTFLVKDLIR